ncbi:MAG: biotin/lipoyl-binding protein [Bacteroidota bacterium]
MTNRKKYAIAGGILLGGIALSALLISLRPEPPRQPAPPSAPLVQTVPVDERDGALRVAGNGTVRPRAEIALAPQIAGRVTYVAPELISGGRVRQGQTLVRLEQADYQNRLQQARADVQQQRVNLLQAEEEARIARDEYERFQARENGRNASPYTGVDADDYAARVLPPSATPGGSNGAAASTSDAEPDSTRLALVYRLPQRDAAQAQLGRAEAVLNDAQLALSRTSIQAPFDAVVRSETIDRGSYVAPGQAIAQLYASDLYEVVVPLAQSEAALLPQLWALQAGQSGRRIPATVSAAYGPYRYEWAGYVDRAESALDETTRTINVVVRVPNPFTSGRRVVESSPEAGEVPVDSAPPLLVGTFVDVTFEGAELDRYLVIPRRALRENNRVWTVEQDSLLRIIPVRVLQNTDSDVFIATDQIAPGQRIVTNDLRAVTDGMKVRAE